MNTVASVAQYLQIAQDLSARIADGDFSDAERLHGRSILASEYNVSPETIRRALHLLAEMKVVEVRPQSGTVVLSRDNARRYAAQSFAGARERTLYAQLRDLLREQAELNRRAAKLVLALAESHTAHAAEFGPLPTCEVAVPEDSPLIGKSIGELRFWQQTGATIVAIRRGRSVILSPGPTAELYGKDTVVLVGGEEAAQTAGRFLKRKRKEEPT